MASLRELQREFAAALRDPARTCAVLPPRNLAVYRHNVQHHYQRALEIAYPVLRRRVGDDYFRQLVHHYRLAFPSKSGDLHWAGREFPRFLTDHLEGSEYVWLSDLARLEWACELAAIAGSRPAVGAEVLGAFAQDQLENLVFEFQPGLELLSSPFPVFSVWQANQVVDAPPVDQSLGQEQGFVLGRDDGPVVRALEPRLFSHLSALADGDTLGEALVASGLDEPGLLLGLQLLFGEGMVCAVQPRDQRSNR